MFSATACASFGPGVRIDEGAMETRGRQVDPDFKIQPITPALVSTIATERRGVAPALKQDPVGASARYDYRIAPFDVLSVTVWDHPELTIPAGEFRSAEATGNPVLADGTVFYPHVGVVEVAGKTVAEVRQLLTARLARVVTNPQLDVRVAAYRGKRIQVTGEVIAAASIPITDVPLRVQDAIAQAKGLTPEADLGRVTLTRGGAVTVLDLLAMYERGDTSPNWLMQDGDVLNIPDRSLNKVFVLGEVRAPASKLMVRGRMSLAEAIGDTQGFDPIAASGIVYVIRGDFRSPAIYKLDARTPDALLLAVQFPLQPHDVVYVATYELARWNRILSQILPTVQALWQTVDITYRTRLLTQ
jgi:polysaccharide biosynthesis/export protein